MKDKDPGKNGPKEVKGAGVLLHRPKSTVVGVPHKDSLFYSKGASEREKLIL